MTFRIYQTTDDDFSARWRLLLARGEAADTQAITDSTRRIVDKVRFQGDAAVVELTAKFDRRPDFSAEAIEVSKENWQKAADELDRDVYAALERAAARIRAFHETQTAHQGDAQLAEGGIDARLIVRPLQRAGLYVPGGTAAYPSTVLMNAVPAKVAGVKEVVMTSPAPDGYMNPAVLAAAQIAGVDRVFAIGGAQAVAAMAYGTDTVPQVDKIVGPGNAWVREAKRLVYGQVDIDSLAGPSEVLILADDSARPEVVAADLLAQAEHDVRAAAVLVTWHAPLAEGVAKALEDQLSTLPRKEECERALRDRGGLILAIDRAEAFALTNAYGTEHLGLALTDAPSAVADIHHAGAVFVGHFTPEALGDYNAGVNHVLPTSGTARFASPLSVHDFIKRMSVLSVSPEGLDHIGDDAIRLARVEGLEAHARAIEIRRKDT